MFKVIKRYGVYEKNCTAVPTEERQQENPENRAGYTPAAGLVFSPWPLHSLC